MAICMRATGRQLFTSLNGIAFPAASVKGHKLTLINGWKSSQSTYRTGSPAYAIRKGAVYLPGSLHQPVSDSGGIGVLPAAASSLASISFPV
jgi:hypothetical protein